LVESNRLVASRERVLLIEVMDIKGVVECAAQNRQPKTTETVATMSSVAGSLEEDNDG
jgi:hypothetical protein